VILNAGAGYNSYLWNTGATSQTLAVTQAGTYSVRVTNVAGCADVDSVKVTVLPFPTANLGPDTFLCPQSQITLTADSGYASYFWSNGGRTRSIRVATPGTYTVQVGNGSCTTSDTIVVGLKMPPPVFGLQHDTAICPGDFITLAADTGYFSYSWNTGAKTRTIQAFAGQTYIVTAFHPCRTIIDSVKITEIQPQKSTLKTPIYACDMDSIQVDAGGGFESYLWSNGATSRTLTVLKSGTYSVMLTDYCGNVSNDTTDVVIAFSDFTPVLANAFSPNGDNINDVFYPVDSRFVDVRDYHFEIYNRWGSRVFETDKPTDGWDGKVNGTLGDPSVYYFTLTYRLCNGNVLKLNSPLNLLR